MIPCAFVFALAKLPRRRLAKMAIIAMTTKSSISVNAFLVVMSINPESVSAAILDRPRNEATGQIRRNPKGGTSFGRRRCCALLTDPLWDMLVARAWPPPKIHRRERHRIYAHDHLVIEVLSWPLVSIKLRVVNGESGTQPDCICLTHWSTVPVAPSPRPSPPRGRGDTGALQVPSHPWGSGSG